MLIYKNGHEARELGISSDDLSAIISELKRFKGTPQILKSNLMSSLFDIIKHKFEYRICVDHIFHRTLFFHVDITYRPNQFRLQSFGQLLQKLLLGNDKKRNNSVVRPCLVKRYKITLPRLMLY